MNESIIAQVLETLNRIESKVDSNHTQLATRLDKHMEDEEEEMTLLTREISDTRHESEQRHNALIQSINSYMDKSIAIETAFLKGQDGKPDFYGHYNDHDTRKGLRDWVVSSAGRGITKLFEGGVIAGFLWILYILWDAFLKGPPK